MGIYTKQTISLASCTAFRTVANIPYFKSAQCSAQTTMEHFT